MSNEIEVTEEDIQNSSSHPSDCPVAIALHRAGFNAPYVAYDEITFYMGVFPYQRKDSINTPRKVKNFITRYDNRKTRKNCRPFKFTIDI